MNTNCLSGSRCPQCGSYGPFYVAATCMVKVHDNGVEEEFDHEWGSDSYCRCADCAYDGKMENFEDPEYKEAAS